jgi:hypothetical protein
MELSTKCPKCGKTAWVAFEYDLLQKVIHCSCGYIAPATDLPFNPNPAFLYKYRPHDRYSESWILNEELFFASPAKFNDPFDSKVMYTMEGTRQRRKNFLKDMLVTKMPQIGKRQIRQMVKNELKERRLEKGYDSHIQRVQGRIDTYGVVSFSRKPDDLLMFSYYAKEHTGYCLKYKRSKENLLCTAREITYEPLYPKFSVYDYTLDKIGLLGDRVLLTKAKCWEREAEWRLSFAFRANQAIKPPHPILEGIILGCNMTSTQRDEIIALNNRREKPVEIFQARKKQFEFALEIVPLLSIR